MWKCPICGEEEPLEFQRGHLDQCSLKHSRDTIGNPDHADAHGGYGYDAEIEEARAQAEEAKLKLALDNWETSWDL